MIKCSDLERVKLIRVPRGLGSKKTKANACGKDELGGGCQSAAKLCLGWPAPAFPTRRLQPRGRIRIGMGLPRKRELRCTWERAWSRQLECLPMRFADVLLRVGWTPMYSPCGEVLAGDL